MLPLLMTPRLFTHSALPLLFAVLLSPLPVVGQLPLGLRDTMLLLFHLALTLLQLRFLTTALFLFLLALLLPLAALLLLLLSMILFFLAQALVLFLAATLLLLLPALLLFFLLQALLLLSDALLLLFLFFPGATPLLLAAQSFHRCLAVVSSWMSCLSRLPLQRLLTDRSQNVMLDEGV